MPSVKIHLKDVGNRRLYILTSHVKYKSFRKLASALLAILVVVHFCTVTGRWEVSSQRGFWYIVVNRLYTCITVLKDVIVTNISSHLLCNEAEDTEFVGNHTLSPWQHQWHCTDTMDLTSSRLLRVEVMHKFSNIRDEYWTSAINVILCHEKCSDWVSDGSISFHRKALGRITS